MSKMVFLSGAMTGISHDDAYNWRHDLAERIEEISEGKWNCFNPAELGFSEFQAYKHEKNFDRLMMFHDLDKLKHSRVVIADFNHQKSLGTAAELATAYELGIPVIGVCEPANRKTLHPWWVNMSMVIVDDYEDALLFFVDYFINND